MDKPLQCETTLATKSYKNLVEKAKLNGYIVKLIFFWLDDIEIAKIRVAERVKEGGHNIPNEVIERRYLAGIQNLFDIYIHIVDELFIFDNSIMNKYDLIYTSSLNIEHIIFNEMKFFKFKHSKK